MYCGYVYSYNRNCGICASDALGINTCVIDFINKIIYGGGGEGREIHRIYIHLSSFDILVAV